MAIKHAIDDREPKNSQKLQQWKQNKDHSQEDFNATIDSNDNGGADGAIQEELEESREKDPVNLKKNSAVRPPNAPKNLEGGDTLKFQLKIRKIIWYT